MRRLIILFIVLINLQEVFAQNLVEQFKAFSNNAENVNLYSGKLDSATCIKMLQIAQEVNNDSLLAISYNLIGEYASRMKGDNTSGLAYYFKAIPLAEKSKDKRRLSSVYFDISLIYFSLQNNEESVKYIRKGGENLPDKLHPLYDFMLAQYQRGMAIYFINTHQADSALAYVQQLILTSNKIKSPLFKFAAYNLTAAAYDEHGDEDVAETFFKKADAISNSVNSPFAALTFGITYIPFLLKNQKFTLAKLQANHLMNVGEQLNNNDLKLSGAGFLRQVYDSLHQIDSAYYYSKMEASINTEVFNENNLNKIQALAFNEQIRNMEEEAKARQLEERRRQDIQYAAIALGIIAFSTLFLLLSRTIIVDEKLISFFAILGLLVVFEFINLLVHPWLVSFTHESPVLMLLALVIIASLLIPLHHRLEHLVRKKMIEKNKAIRLAAAKRMIEKLENKTGGA